MIHQNVWKEFAAYLPVQSLSPGFLHFVIKGGKLAYWISERGHAGEVLHTGILVDGTANEEKFDSVPEALRALGIFKGGKSVWNKDHA